VVIAVTKLYCEGALVGDGWRRDVLITSAGPDLHHWNERFGAAPMPATVVQPVATHVGDGDRQFL